LPAIVGCLLLDGVDQTIFQTFGFDPPGYQSYDKAMDVFYLSIAYLASMRNWRNQAAFKVGRFLFYFRQVGVVAFELTGLRLLLLLFPNTFEYFFIAYEAIRTRRNPARYGLKFWVLVAGAIWIFIKLPQEYWIHIAQLDLTDTIRDVPWFLPTLVVALLALAAVALLVVRPRLRPADWPWRFRADPLPAEIDEAHERAAYQAAHRKVFDAAALEKVFLIGLITVIYGQVLPGVEASSLQLFLGIGVFVVINSAIGLWSARRGYSWESAATSFAVVFATNVVLVALADLLLSRGNGGLRLVDTLFFVFLLSILTTLYDRYRPINDYRAAAQTQTDAAA
jgi:multisubunit Na+/H+ antiporter MnhG subunit